MRSQDHRQIIILQEIANSVRTEFHNITSSIGISDEVRLDANLMIIVSGIRPQNIHHQLLLLSRDLMNDLKRTRNASNLADVSDSRANATMQTDYFILDDSRKR